MIMEHFEVHKERLDDLIVEMAEKGPATFKNVPLLAPDTRRPLSINDFALIDEMSGLTDYLDNFMMSQGLPETTRERIRARIVRYEGPKPKEIAKNELRISMFGDQR